MPADSVELVVRAKNLTDQAFGQATTNVRRLREEVNTTTFGKLEGSLRQFDDVLDLAGGPHLRDAIQGFGQLGDVASGTSGKLDGLAKAGLIASAAMAGIKVGRMIADFTGSDKVIGDFTSKLLGFGDVAGQQAAAAADTLARASKNAGRQITDMSEAIRINEAAVKAHSIALKQANGPAEAARMIADWRGELDKLRAAGSLEALRKQVEDGTIADTELAKTFGISADALKLFSGEVKKSTTEHEKAADAAKQHADEIKKLAEAFKGTTAIRSAQDAIEALHAAQADGIDIGKMTIDQQQAIAKTVQAATDAYHAMGRAVPPELHAVALAVHAMSDAARQDLEQTTAALAKLEDGLRNIPVATLPGGNAMEDATWVTRQSLVGRDMTKLFVGGAQQIDAAAVAAAAAKRVQTALAGNGGFWKQTFGSPEQFGAELSATIIGAIQGGGNVANAAGGMIGGEIGTSTARSLTDTGSKLFNTALGGVLNSALPVVGSLIGPLAGKLWDSLFGSAGRDAVKDFAAKNGGFDALHASLSVLGAEGEKLWINLTQGVGKNNPAEAKKAIDAINDALAHAPTSMADQAANAGFQTTAQLDVVANDAVKLWAFMRDSGTYSASQVQAAWEKAQSALSAAGHDSSATIQTQLDQAKDALKQLDDQIAKLQESVDSEQTEDVMGDVEKIERAKLDAMKKEREAAASHVEDLQQQLIDSMNDVANALKNIPTQITIDVRTRYGADGGDPTSGREPMPAHAAGAYIRQDHVARVHAGEIVGPVDFIARAMRQAGGSGSDGPLAVAPLYVDGQKLTDIVIRRAGNSVRRFGVRSLATV